MRRSAAFLAISATFFAMACGKDPIDPVTGGEGSGSEGFAVIVTDDPGLEDETLEGRATGTIRVALRNDAGALVDLGSEEIELDLHEGADSVALSELSRPPVDDYTAVQIRFDGMDVEVLAGSVVGDSTLAQDVVLDVGGAGLATIEVLVPVFSVENATLLDIVVDLNSESWVTATNLDDLVVSQTDLANTVTVDVN